MTGHQSDPKTVLRTCWQDGLPLETSHSPTWKPFSEHRTGHRWQSLLCVYLQTIKAEAFHIMENNRFTKPVIGNVDMGCQSLSELDLIKSHRDSR